jgi:hypothetical protein
MMMMMMMMMMMTGGKVHKQEQKKVKYLSNQVPFIIKFTTNILTVETYHGKLAQACVI